jgi:hypothetical protein
MLQSHFVECRAKSQLEPSRRRHRRGQPARQQRDGKKDHHRRHREDADQGVKAPAVVDEGDQR